MNAITPINIGPGYDRLADAMDAEGIRLVERYKIGWRVVMRDGQEATGFSIREAINRAAQVAE